ncbi:Ataxin-7 [Sciurus carolinensis]|uniref:Ataxin-7 n=1 Tax=Sciurus carolinensis TaxID=30640 RepID=A0AA41NBD5_SCICA|nr:Ataxin-7 [Sciurus carolinensis]
MESFRKNCVAHPGPPYLSVLTSPHSIGLDCVVNRAPTTVLRHEQSGRGPLSGSPAESIKRMSVMVNSGDSTLSLGPFDHQSSELPVNTHSGFPLLHSPLDRLIGKKRKCSPGSGGGGSKPNKVAKLPAMNNVHMKHAGTISGAQGLSKNFLLHQVGCALGRGPASPWGGWIGLSMYPASWCHVRGKSWWSVGWDRLLCGTSGVCVRYSSRKAPWGVSADRAERSWSWTPWRMEAALSRARETLQHVPLQTDREGCSETSKGSACDICDLEQFQILWLKFTPYFLLPVLEGGRKPGVSMAIAED